MGNQEPDWTPPGGLQLTIHGRVAVPVQECLNRRVPPVVYRMYDTRQRLLYVGMTEQPLAVRLLRHQEDKRWWSEVAYVTIEPHASIAGASRAELAAIETESPRYNRAGRPHQYGLFKPAALERLRTRSEAEMLAEAKQAFDEMIRIRGGSVEVVDEEEEE